EKPAKRVASGRATTDLIFSAHVGGNSEIFPQILALHVPPGSTVADVTFGQGVFWRKVNLAHYKLLASDIAAKPQEEYELFPGLEISVSGGVDCRKLPYKDISIDALVLDPPYMEGLFRRSVDHLAGSGTHTAFRNAYSDGMARTDGPKWHDAVTDLY